VDDESSYKYKTYLPPFQADPNPPKFSAPPPPGPPAYEPGAVHSPLGEFMGQFSDRSPDEATARRHLAAEPTYGGSPRLGGDDASSRSGLPASRGTTGSIQQQPRPLGPPPTFDVGLGGPASEAEAPSAPPSASPAAVLSPVALRHSLPGSAFTRRAEPGLSWFTDRFHDQSAGASNPVMPQSPLLRELARVRDAVAAGARPPPSGVTSFLFPGGQRQSSDLANDADEPGASRTATAPIRILRSRPAGQASPAPPVPAAIAPYQLPILNPMPSFDDRFGHWTSMGNASAPSLAYQQVLPTPQPAGSEGTSTGNAAADSSFALPAIGDATPGFEDWVFPWARRSPWDAGQ